MVTKSSRTPYDKASYPWSFQYWDDGNPAPTGRVPGFEDWSIEHQLSNARFSMGMAKPNSSGFRVGEASLVEIYEGDSLLTSFGTYGFNYEPERLLLSPSKPDAVHGEEAIVAGILRQLKPNLTAKIRILAIATDADPAFPCGNCRDILKPFMFPDSIVVSGNALTGEAKAVKYSELVPEFFPLAEKGELEGIPIETALQEYARLSSRKEPPGVLALAYGKEGQTAFGAELPNWAYHHTTGSGIALWNYKHRNDSPAQGLVLLGSGLVVPEASGKVAQLGVYRREFQNALQYSEKGAPITIASPSENGLPALTGPVENFLPYPFSLKGDYFLPSSLAF